MPILLACRVLAPNKFGAVDVAPNPPKPVDGAPNIGSPPAAVVVLPKPPLKNEGAVVVAADPKRLKPVLVAGVLPNPNPPAEPNKPVVDVVVVPKLEPNKGGAVDVEVPNKPPGAPLEAVDPNKLVACVFGLLPNNPGVAAKELL